MSRIQPLILHGPFHSSFWTKIEEDGFTQSTLPFCWPQKADNEIIDLSCPLPSLNCWIFAWTMLFYNFPFTLPSRVSPSVEMRLKRLNQLLGWSAVEKFSAAFQPLQPHFNRARKFLTYLMAGVHQQPDQSNYLAQGQTWTCKLAETMDIFCRAGSVQQAQQSTRLAEGLNPL